MSMLLLDSLTEEEFMALSRKKKSEGDDKK